MECQYCNHTFKNEYTLKTHQTKAKYCLEIQGSQIPTNFVCEYCQTPFTRKSSLQKHHKICKANTEYVRFYKDRCVKHEQEIVKLKEQLEASSKREERLLKELTTLAAIVAGKLTIDDTGLSSED